MAGARFQLFSDVPHYSIQVELEGNMYSLLLAFNDRDGCWYIRPLTEAEQPLFYESGWPVGPRRVIAVGDWLTVLDDDRLTVAQFRLLYDLTGCFFPGVLYAVSSRPLEGERADADVIQLEYVDAATLEAAGG